MRRRLETWTAAVAGARAGHDELDAERDAEPAVTEQETLDRMRAALRDDLDTPSALRAVDHWAAGRPVAVSPLLPDAIDALLGVLL